MIPDKTAKVDRRNIGHMEIPGVFMLESLFAPAGNGGVPQQGATGGVGPLDDGMFFRRVRLRSDGVNTLGAAAAVGDPMQPIVAGAAPCRSRGFVLYPSGTLKRSAAGSARST